MRAWLLSTSVTCGLWPSQDPIHTGGRVGYHRTIMGLPVYPVPLSFYLLPTPPVPPTPTHPPCGSPRYTPVPQTALGSIDRLSPLPPRPKPMIASYPTPIIHMYDYGQLAAAARAKNTAYIQEYRRVGASKKGAPPSLLLAQANGNRRVRRCAATARVITLNTSRREANTTEGNSCALSRELNF